MQSLSRQPSAFIPILLRDVRVLAKETAEEEPSPLRRRKLAPSPRGRGLG